MKVTDYDIAEYLLAACIAAGHKPGKVQFTKYMYQLDYCHWRYTGQKATSLPWKFYHYGPWCDEIEDCMAGLAFRYSFNWRELESSIISSVEVGKSNVPIIISSLINQIIDLFKNKDLNVLLDVTYSQTEPMIAAQRGTMLDFTKVPITHSIPQYFPKFRETTPYEPSPAIRAQMEAIKARIPKLRAMFEKEKAFRQTPVFAQAMEYLSQDLSSEDIPNLRISLTPEVVDDLSHE